MANGDVRKISYPAELQIYIKIGEIKKYFFVKFLLILTVYTTHDIIINLCKKYSDYPKKNIALLKKYITFSLGKKSLSEPTLRHSLRVYYAAGELFLP